MNHGQIPNSVNQVGASNFQTGRPAHIHAGAGQINHNPHGTPAAAPHVANNTHNVNFLTGQRDKEAFKNAHSHSGRVRFLRVLLPVIAFFMVTGVALSYYWHKAGSPTLQVEAVNLDDGNLVMRNPVLKGVDKDGRPYELIAKEAIQDANNLTQISLNQIDANVPMDENTFAQIKAGNGFYDSEAKTLLLGGSVDLQTDDGMSIQLLDADINIGTGRIFTDNHVTFNSAAATVNSDGVLIENNGENIVFPRNVKMTIYPKGVRAAQNAANQ